MIRGEKGEPAFVAGFRSAPDGCGLRENHAASGTQVALCHTGGVWLNIPDTAKKAPETYKATFFTTKFVTNT